MTAARPVDPEAAIQLDSTLAVCCKVTWEADSSCEAFGAPSVHGCGHLPKHEGDHLCTCGAVRARRAAVRGRQ